MKLRTRKDPWARVDEHSLKLSLHYSLPCQTTASVRLAVAVQMSTSTSDSNTPQKISAMQLFPKSSSHHPQGESCQRAEAMNKVPNPQPRTAPKYSEASSSHSPSSMAGVPRDHVLPRLDRVQRKIGPWFGISGKSQRIPKEHILGLG